MSEVTIRITGEIDPEDLRVTQGDLLYAMQNQRSRILERTERGVDVDERPFAPYNQTRPYYLYPSGKVSRIRARAQDLQKEKRNVKRTAKKLGGRVSRSGLGIRFDSYEAFKFAGLGRNNVDLRGPRAPHMLQEIDIKAAGTTIPGNKQQVIRTDENPQPLDNGVMGIYGDAAKRAAGINSDDRPKGMPQRRFFGTSDSDNQAFAGDIEKRIGERARRGLAGRR